jgi:regulator of extracellular matrix RemA (YlzA/DUF370 family)
MYIHLGNDIVISSKNVIAIVNIENPISDDLKDIMEIAALDKKMITISEKDKKKAMVICDDYVYLSPISSSTLYKRAINDYKEV